MAAARARQTAIAEALEAAEAKMKNAAAEKAAVEAQKKADEEAAAAATARKKAEEEAIQAAEAKIKAIHLAEVAAKASAVAESARKQPQKEPVCDCSAPVKCSEALKTDIGTKFPGGGAGNLKSGTRDWGAWDPVSGVPRIGCTDTVTHAFETRFRRQADGKEMVSPVNRFYGSTIFGPLGKAMSEPGYTPEQEADALCLSVSRGTPANRKGCPDECAYSCCNCGQSYTVQCPRGCFKGAVPVYGDPKQAGRLGPYQDTSSICRAAILSGQGTNDDSFYTTFTIVEPVRAYMDPGGGNQIVFEQWDRLTNPQFQNSVSDKCCNGGWPPQLGKSQNARLTYRAGFKNEWQNIRAFNIEGAVKNLCLPGFKFKRGTKVPGDPTCIVDHAQMYSPVEGCDQCVEDTTKVMCGTRTEINDSLQKQFECVCQTSNN